MLFVNKTIEKLLEKDTYEVAKKKLNSIFKASVSRKSLPVFNEVKSTDSFNKTPSNTMAIKQLERLEDCLEYPSLLQRKLKEHVSKSLEDVKNHNDVNISRKLKEIVKTIDTNNSVRANFMNSCKQIESTKLEDDDLDEELEALEEEMFKEKMRNSKLQKQLELVTKTKNEENDRTGEFY